ncbi:tigger transposable element-derived protein 1-like [Diorhabda sublineata]|uniref:tigger transposable element-derived protein 1-like n=1 Tax=Diorhabda sublineata TaxID=1163346 RepID=UPI0024E0DCC4|nr:tigger transposable element-derived protein 1-like [Diorhabda sublineata]
MVRKYIRKTQQQSWSEDSMIAAIQDARNNILSAEKAARRDWIYGFLTRNKNISLRLPEYTSAARASSFNKFNVSSFFELLKEMFEKHKYPPSRIFNCDETGVSTVGCVSSAERGTLTTAEICFNAVGFYIPPLVIFPRIRKCPALEHGLPPESIVEYHPSGWMQSEIFSDVWFNHFLKYTKPSETESVLLILDGHATHTKNLTLVEKARANYVNIIVIPPHTSHRLQPLDVTFMFPLNTYYEQETKKWFLNNPGKVITLYQVGELFGNAFKRAANAQNAINGFKATGIYPYNPDVFPEELFKPAETTDRLPEDERPNTPQSVLLENRFNEINQFPQPGPSRVKSPSPIVHSELKNHKL